MKYPYDPAPHDVSRPNGLLGVCMGVRSPIAPVDPPPRGAGVLDADRVPLLTRSAILPFTPLPLFPTCLVEFGNVSVAELIFHERTLCGLTLG